MIRTLINYFLNICSIFTVGALNLEFTSILYNTLLCKYFSSSLHHAEVSHLLFKASFLHEVEDGHLDTAQPTAIQY